MSDGYYSEEKSVAKYEFKELIFCWTLQKCSVQVTSRRDPGNTHS